VQDGGHASQGQIAGRRLIIRVPESLCIGKAHLGHTGIGHNLPRVETGSLIIGKSKLVVKRCGDNSGGFNPWLFMFNPSRVSRKAREKKFKIGLFTGQH
jgi:hypothetical protein